MKTLRTLKVALALTLSGLGLMNSLSPLYADSFGTGFFVSNDGHMVTNFHVIENATNIAVKYKDTFLPASVVTFDETNDLAVLKVEAPADISYLPVAAGHSVTPGQEVFTVGFPDPTVLGVTPKTTRGNLSAMNGIKDDPRFYQISVQIQPGNSGGPLVTETGNVIGVTTQTLNSFFVAEQSGYLPQNVNYAVKADYVRPLLDSVRDFQPASLNMSKLSGEANFAAVQRRVEDSIGLIIAEGAAQPEVVAQETEEAQVLTPEEQGQAGYTDGTPSSGGSDSQEAIRNTPVTVYRGNVGNLEAMYFIQWISDNDIRGTYFYPKRGMEQTYTLVGNNPQQGVLYLDEYTGEALSARCTLKKRVTDREIIWEGTMDNTDGRSFNMVMRRER